jgi:hypothetical protein
MRYVTMCALLLCLFSFFLFFGSYCAWIKFYVICSLCDFVGNLTGESKFYLILLWNYDARSPVTLLFFFKLGGTYIYIYFFWHLRLLECWVRFFLRFEKSIFKLFFQMRTYIYKKEDNLKTLINLFWSWSNI